jgi:hypothetical protein
VLTLRDSAVIARLFGMRPTFVKVWQRRPEDASRHLQDSVRVEYEAPEIPAPGSATRADAARSRRSFEERIHSNVRYIGGGVPVWEPLWLVVGDSTEVSLGEMHCVYDSCTSGYSTLTDSGWAIHEPEIARVDTIATSRFDHMRVTVRGPGRYVKALRPGRTTLRVIGVHGASDTVASSKPPARELTREIIVTRPIRRVEIVPRPDTVRVRERFTLRVRVTDSAGEELAGLPVTLDVLDGDRTRHDASKSVDLSLTSPGSTRIVARLGTYADTVTVTVVGPR